MLFQLSYAPMCSCVFGLERKRAALGGPWAAPRITGFVLRGDRLRQDLVLPVLAPVATEPHVAQVGGG